MQLVSHIPQPKYLGVYDFENSNLVEQFHQNSFEIISGIFKEIIPPLIECVFMFGLTNTHEDDDTIYQYADELYRTLLIDQYKTYSPELIYFINDNQTDLVNMSVYLSLNLGRKIFPIISTCSLGVRIHDISTYNQHYRISYSVGNE